jgi:hypothetical protein
VRITGEDLVCSFCGEERLRLLRMINGVPYEIQCVNCRATWGFHGDEILTTGGPKPLTIQGELGDPELTAN